jgi:hypothetical protein
MEQRQEIPDSLVKDAADQYEAARRILEAQGPGPGILLPLLNVAATAIELYLKLLSAIKVHRPISSSIRSTVHVAPKQGKRNGHVLKDLLDVVPGEVRERLECEFLERCSADLSTTLPDYEKLLSESRYSYEESSDLKRYPLGKLMELSAFFHDFVAQMPVVERIHYFLDAKDRPPRTLRLSTVRL